MATNQIQKGDNIDVTLAAKVASGAGVQIGSLFGVASVDGEIADKIVIMTVGVFSMAKVSAQAWAVGDPIYFDDGASPKVCTTVGGDNTLIGVATEIAANPSATGVVRLNGPPGLINAIVEAGAVADLTEAAGAIGGSSDGDLPDLTATAAALTGSLTGSTNGALVDVAATAGSCAGTDSPSATNVDSAIATAVASIVTGVNTQNKELLEAINKIVADNVALRAAIRELAAKQNVTLARLRTTNVISV